MLMQKPPPRTRGTLCHGQSGVCCLIRLVQTTGHFPRFRIASLRSSASVRCFKREKDIGQALRTENARSGSSSASQRHMFIEGDTSGQAACLSMWCERPGSEELKIQVARATKMQSEAACLKFLEHRPIAGPHLCLHE